MITIDNQEVKNVTIDGQEVKSITVDGVLAWSSTPIGEIYKRRIMVGDNLRGKNVYATFPVGWYMNIPNSTGYDVFPIIKDESGMQMVVVCCENDEGVFFKEISLAESNQSFGSDTVLYNYYSYNNIESFTTHRMFPEPEIDRVVGSVVDAISNEYSKHYRHIFVEDSNLRPIEVGDNLSGATIYCNFPDIIGPNLPTGYINDANTILFRATNNIVGSNNDLNFASIDIGDMYNGEYITSLYFYLLSEVEPYENISKYQLTNELGVVTEVNKNHPAYNMILVDTTTISDTPQI